MTVKEPQGMIFIDANSYLTLYWGEVKKVLPRLEELRDYIFVTQQIVAEVHRKKVEVAAGFFAQQVKNGKMELEQTQDLLGQVSQSKDEVSKTLAGIFSQAVEDTKDELQHARERRERGNPPGNKSDPLGDQLNWEQVLSHCQNKSGLWIITNDGDYATKYGSKHEEKMFLNAALYQDVARRYEPEPAPEIFCFYKIIAGLDHFAAKTGVKVEKLSSEEIEKINKEQESSLDWLGNYDDAAALVVVQRNEWIRRASLASQMSSDDAGRA
jgi:PIN domain